MPIVMRSDFTGQADPNADNYGHPDPYGLAGFIKSNPDEFYKMQNSGMGLDQIQKAIGGQANSGYQGLIGLYQPGNPLYGMKGAGALPGGGGSSSGSGIGGSFSYGGRNPFATDAAAAKLRDEFARLKRTGQGAMNEDLNSRGIFSSGVGAKLSNDQQTQYGLAEGAALEDLYNRSSQQQMAFDLEQQRMALSAAAGGGAQGQRFGSANDNQAMMESQGIGGPSGVRIGGSPTGGQGGGTMTQPAAAKGGQTYGADGQPMNKNAPGYFNEWQAWFRAKQQVKTDPYGQQYSPADKPLIGAPF